VNFKFYGRGMTTPPGFDHTVHDAPLALVTGASRGFGLALATSLADNGWRLVIDARDPRALERAAAPLGAAVWAALPGDVADPAHRDQLATAVARAGHLDLLVHNASTLGPTPMRSLADLDVSDLVATHAVNTAAPLALTQLVLQHLLSSQGTVVSLSSDAAVEAYETWGAYGSTKAALDHLVRVLGAEQPGIRAYVFDPGDMRTQMQADAFPGEDISDRPLPETVVPALLRLLAERPESGRFRAADLLATQRVGA
jgi:NAD(P)-dependent dehydrogenase (short-subunit alcohol dehydrogenase family)